MNVSVLHFWSPTCNPCRVIKPALEDIKEEFEGRIQWQSINTHDDPTGLGQSLGIKVVPTVVVFKDGVEFARHSGVQLAIYYAIIRKALAAD